MCVERARVKQRADDEHDGEGDNRGGSRQRFHEGPPDCVLVMTRMPRSVILLPRDHNVVLSHALFFFDRFNAFCALLRF